MPIKKIISSSHWI